jgi:putative tryptophan/tyrosine transport system substrate-binding protein
VDRRTFIGSVSGGLIAAGVVRAQRPGKIGRIGYLGNNRPMNPALAQALNQLGYVDGTSAVFEPRFTEGRDDRLPALAAELVRLDVDVLIVLSGPGAFAAKEATATIPIVLAGVSDPVGRGLVKSLAHPGGNITGIANLQLELNPKRIEILKQAIPKIARVVSVGNWDKTVAAVLTEQDAAARAIGVIVHRIEINAPSDFETVAAAIVREQPDALMLLPVPLTFRLRKEFAEFALAHRLPTIAWQRDQVLAGILMTYAPSNDDMFRRTAMYTDRILKGAKPADLPIEQPTKFELIINLKTAKTLGITLPASLVARADEVIE